MTTVDYGTLATNLNNDIRDCSDIRTWQEAQDRESAAPGWQLTILSRVLAVIGERPIEYLTAGWDEQTGMRLVVFCENLVLDLQTSKTENNEYMATRLRVIAQSSITAVEINSVQPIPWGVAEWPNRVELTVDFGETQIALPLDRYASNANRRRLARFYPSLFDRLADRSE
jgi:hypothetical protein